MSNAELQANAISTVRHGPALRAAGSGIVFLVILALSLTSLLVAFLRWWTALAIFTGVAGAYLVFAQLLFDGGLYLPLVYPLFALAIAGLGTLLARVYVARQNRPRRRSVAALSSPGQSPIATPARLERA